MEFGKVMAQFNQKSKIILIPAAVGGTKISYWGPSDERGLYQEAIRKSKVAMKNGKLKGIIWQQGESDSYQIEDITQYKERLIELINSFRKDLNNKDVPIVIGGLGDFLNSEYVSQLNDILQEVASIMKNVGYSKASKLGHIGDNLHFNSEAQKENGRNMANEMIYIQKRI